jgi:hypothetical protein
MHGLIENFLMLILAALVYWLTATECDPPRQAGGRR